MCVSSFQRAGYLAVGPASPRTFYRVCRGGDEVEVNVVPFHGPATRPLSLWLRREDLYVTKVAGRPVGRYPSNLGLKVFGGDTLDHAVRAIPGMSNVRERFPIEMLLVLCIAESIRFDGIATELCQMLRAGQGTLRGVEARLKPGPWERCFKNWEDASAAVWRGLSDEARRVLRSVRRPGTADARFSERVTLRPADAGWTDVIRTLKVLKLPAA